MLEKILLLLLISLIKSEQIKVNFLDQAKGVEINNNTNFILCIQLPEKIKKNNEFYLLMDCEEKNAKINKNIYYDFQENSCVNLKNKNIDLDNPSKEFNYNENIPNLEEDKKGIHYEYKISKKENNKNYVMMLFRDFSGEQIKFNYSFFSLRVVLIITIIIVIAIILFITLFIIILCKCYLRKKEPQIMKQYKTSFIDDNN